MRHETPRIERQPTAAVFGDFGNDLAFGFEAVEVLDALDECVAWLPQDCTLIWIRPPWAAVGELSAVQFAALSKAIYPRHRIDRGRLMRELEWLDDGLMDRCAASEGRVTLVDVPGSWMTWDRIHVRRGRLQQWATRVVDPIHRGSEGENQELEKGALSIPWLTRVGFRAEVCDLHIAGRHYDVGVEQPCYTDSRGSTLSLY